MLFVFSFASVGMFPEKHSVPHSVDILYLYCLLSTICQDGV